MRNLIKPILTFTLYIVLASMAACSSNGRGFVNTYSEEPSAIGWGKTKVINKNLTCISVR